MNHHKSRREFLKTTGILGAVAGSREMALNSREDLTPPRYAWDVAMPVPAVARPGVTEFR